MRSITKKNNHNRGSRYDENTFFATEVTIVEVL